MSSFARDLRAWRLKADLTQAIAAEYLSISLRTYNRYENDKGFPTYRDIQRIRAIMDLVDGNGVQLEGRSRARV
jgi:transcriptional regulator with XRE-family HTH domain